jgi:NADPH:quinone reductase-like Zn-dependent oxidoreductase
VQKNLSALAPDGRIVQIAFLQGAKVKDFDFMLLMLKRLTITGATLRSRPLAAKAAIAAALREKIWPLLDSGEVKPVLHATFPLEDARAAHELMESSAHLGKIVLITGK